jgi:hypothetical protein
VNSCLGWLICAKQRAKKSLNHPEASETMNYNQSINQWKDWLTNQLINQDSCTVLVATKPVKVIKFLDTLAHRRASDDREPYSLTKDELKVFRTYRKDIITHRGSLKTVTVLVLL